MPGKDARPIPQSSDQLFSSHTGFLRFHIAQVSHHQVAVLTNTRTVDQMAHNRGKSIGDASRHGETGHDDLDHRHVRDREDLHVGGDEDLRVCREEDLRVWSGIRVCRRVAGGDCHAVRREGGEDTRSRDRFRDERARKAGSVEGDHHVYWACREGSGPWTRDGETRGGAVRDGAVRDGAILGEVVHGEAVRGEVDHEESVHGEEGREMGIHGEVDHENVHDQGVLDGLRADRDLPDGGKEDRDDLRDDVREDHDL